MEYFDSKVLESFMIPEESIAIEGFGSTIIEIGRKLFNFLITMITKLISILGNLINRFKRGKTVHNDKETYQENKRLVDATHDDLRELLLWIPFVIDSITDSAYIIGSNFIEAELKYKTPDDESGRYDKLINKINTELLKFEEKYKSVESKLNGKTIYLEKGFHDSLIKRMEESKSRLIKINERLKKELDKELKNGEKSTTEDLIKESQKRYNIMMSYSTKLNVLFNNTVKLITQCVSPDVITDDDRYRFEV